MRDHFRIEPALWFEAIQEEYLNLNNFYLLNFIAQPPGITVDLQAKAQSPCYTCLLYQYPGPGSLYARVKCHSQVFPIPVVPLLQKCMYT